MARARTLIVLISLAALTVPTTAPARTTGAGARTLAADEARPVRAGAAAVDSTWHVGASSGQYAGEGPGVYGSQGADPHAHATTSRMSYGLQGRESVRALVIEGADGQRIALVTNDLYIPQDMINRRVAGILAEHDLLVDLGERDGPKTGITEANLTVSVSHSHSSPYYSTPAWGPWLFEDVFDIRFYEHIAQKMADAVIAASSRMVPVRMGGATSPFDKTQRHSFGPTVADDGTPAGYPETDNDKTVAVVRFDDMSDPGAPKPLATWVVFGLHPEMLDGNDLLTSEYVNTMERFVDREIGGVTLFSQNNTGTAEPARDGRAQPPQARAEFSHREYAQMERAARLLADAVTDTWRDIADGTPADPNQYVPFSTSFPVKIADLRFAPPSYRVSPTVSNCRAEKTFAGNPGVPLAGLPDCEFPAGGVTGPIIGGLPVSPRVGYDTLRAAGVPVPDNYGFPSFLGLQETLTVHLQAIRLGGIAITVCPCEQWADQSRNIKSRLDKIAGNLHIGFDWTTRTVQRGVVTRPWCVSNGNGTWTCADPRDPSRDLPPVPDLAYRRMVAQINNPADGWEAIENTLHAEYDPADPALIKGNYTHEELTPHGYDMVITAGMSNDYWGYIATYREYQRGDHYRKALTGLGPHASDFLATRLSRMAASLNGGPPVALGPKDLAYAPENTRQHQTAQAIGVAARAAIAAYEAQLPNDGGTPAITSQPSDIARFDAAKVQWIGGSNYTDTPDVRVERLVDGSWQPYADGSGEVQYRVHYPQTADLSAYRAGEFAWRWTATFEAFNSDIELVDASGDRARQTPAGTYRFVITGARRAGVNDVRSYALSSEPFEVRAWNGITVEDARIEEDGTVSFAIGPVGRFTYGTDTTYTVGPVDYPDSYSSPFPFINGNRNASQNLRRYGSHVEQFCFECSFRPWADAARVSSAMVNITTEDGTIAVPATLGEDGRWHTTATVPPGGSASIEPGAITDEFGEINTARATAT